MRWISFVVNFLVFHLLTAANSPKKTKSKKPSNLFPINHPNVSRITVKNYRELIADSNTPWLVDFYHPYCAYCKKYVPEWEKIAAHFKKEGRIRVGAVSCLEEHLCSSLSIKGFPNVVAFNFLEKRGENERLLGTHDLSQVLDLVDKWEKINSDSRLPKTDETIPQTKQVVQTTTSVPTPIPIWEETTLASDPRTRLQDAASAFIFGLKDSIFMGRTELDDMELDALKVWLSAVARSFPGIVNRQVLTKLWIQVRHHEYLNHATWMEILKAWQLSATATLSDFRIDSSDVQEWQRIPDLFDGDGTSYAFCGGYTCGQWTLYHMMTVNPVDIGNDNELPVLIIGGIRRFMKHFFNCYECRQHFLDANPLRVVTDIYEATDRKQAIRLWLWRMHNSVNTRLGHPQWPKKSVCNDCGTNGNWSENLVDLWLLDFYGYNNEAFSLHYPVLNAKAIMSAEQESNKNLLSTLLVLFVVCGLTFVYRRLKRKTIHHAH